MPRKALSLSPWYVFSDDGHWLALDVAKSTFISLGSAARHLLEELDTGVALPEAARRVAAIQGEEASRSAVDEYRRLQEQGLFAAPVRTWDESENRAYVQKEVSRPSQGIALYLAEACNLACKYCYASDNSALSQGLMSQDVVQAAVDLLFERSGAGPRVRITFFGGEPLLNKPGLRFAIEYSQHLAQQTGKKVSYSMTTNGTLLDDEVIGCIKRYNFGLMISMDGPKEIHDDNRPMADGSSSFDIAAPRIKRLMARRRTVTARCTISSLHPDKKRIVRFLEDFGFTRVAVSRCTGKAYRLDSLDIGPKEQGNLWAQDRELCAKAVYRVSIGERAGYNPFERALQDIYNRRQVRLRCGVGRGSVGVGSDGKLYPCHRYVGMQAYVIGDVWKGVDKEKLRAYLTEYFKVKTKCHECWAIHLCGGPCPWYVSREDGRCVPPPDSWCDEIRLYYEEAAKLYTSLAESHPEYLARIVGADKENKNNPTAREGR